ncbi:proline--tRNA ligase [Mycoplasmopsis agassizii]|uniref:Proline--tRNA ligase n=1 Tax=Mycoplasmopsis agassizii TaxID=33922 RepID=A0ABX4H4X9_9BACT|nr:proline--tRNA ligase [Mycoplasmopsis agassizii]PAF54952.1 proline--tRNA ligase [Mycoplasmopsis agassizii]SMC17004.1 prolyl-tRNA synthetase [Mycoplasmopsis agassizii]
MSQQVNSKRVLNKITPQSEDFARWYTDVVVNGKLIEYGPVRGTVIIKPNAYGIWERFQEIFNKELKKLNIPNMYFPMFIPKSLMDLESDHILGFAPELATVTQVGDKKLTEHIYARPTSEVLFCKYFANNSHSYKDYPIMANQWANVIRWEKTTNPFLRTTEFLWQEGHTIHSQALDARRMTIKMHKLQEKIFKKYFAIPVMIGKKTPREKFAGACSTYTCEAMMKDGKALQSATSHYLAQNFSKPFDIKFKNEVNEIEYAYQTSWGMSTRIIGALIMTHGDDRGLIIPPYIAPTQIDLLSFNPKLDINLDNYIRNIEKSITNIYRVRTNYSDSSIGYKASESEIQGIPIRIEVGPRDFEQNSVTLVRRDTLEKKVVKQSDLKNILKDLIKDIHDNLYESARKRLNDNLIKCSNFDEIIAATNAYKWAVAPFCCGNEKEELIQETSGATARLILVSDDKEDMFDADKIKKPCSMCGNLTRRHVVFAKAY